MSSGEGDIYDIVFVHSFHKTFRYQTHKGGAKYPSVWLAFKTILREEGVTRGLYRGLSLNYIKTLPNVAIYMSLYDLIKIYIL